uniref:Uncharacterized protein n=1 Tax=Panthera leo TaxID=9689 RepID=A0A8C8X1G2_PANLE
MPLQADPTRATPPSLTGSWAALTGTCAKLPVMVEDLLGCWSLPFSLCVPMALRNLDGLGVTLWRSVGSPFRWYRHGVWWALPVGPTVYHVALMAWELRV